MTAYDDLLRSLLVERFGALIDDAPSEAARHHPNAPRNPGAESARARPIIPGRADRVSRPHRSVPTVIQV